MAELELIFEELSHNIRAFSHLSRSMKRALAKVGVTNKFLIELFWLEIVRWESREHAGTVIFREGEMGESWFVVLRGALKAKTSGKKVPKLIGIDQSLI